MPPRPVLLERPPQGWSSLLLFLGMLVIVGFSIADARPLDIAGQARTGTLVAIMLPAGLVGFILGRSTLGIVRAHVIGAAAGAALLVLIVAAAVQGLADPLPSSVGDLERRLAGLSAALSADIELWWRSEDGGVPMPATVLVVLGAICWTTGQFGAFSIFRYARGGPAVLATGILLFLNVALPVQEPGRPVLPAVPVLALFSALAMLLLMRLQLTQQGIQWARRHIADTGEVARLFLRTGTLFVVLTVLGATSLTALAAPRPDIDARDFEGPLSDLGKEMSRWLALFGVSAAPDPRSALEERLEIPSVWKEGTGLAFTATLDLSSSLRGNYWWARAFDDFDGSWGQAAAVEVERDPTADLPSDLDGPLVPIRAQVLPAGGPLTSIAALGPAEIERVGRPVSMTAANRAGRGRAYVEFEDVLDGPQVYEVTAYAHDYVGQEGSLTADDLRAAPRDYSRSHLRWLRERYLQVPDGVSWPRVRALARRVAEEGQNPYDQALWLQRHLSAMEYDPDPRLACDPIDLPECLLLFERGFCTHYATTMAMVLRSLPEPVPTRLVEGYLPSLPDGRTYRVPERALHAWVEVYFPTYGWIRFDPTPGEQIDLFGGQATEFLPDRSGEPGNGTPTPRPTLLPEPTPEATLAAEASADPEALPPTASGGGGLVGSLLLVGGIVGAALLGLGALLLVRLRRLAGADGGVAYLGIVSLASRLGYGPHPSQTEYEYAGTLSETLPSVRQELYLVAGTHVETAYGRRPMTDERFAALRRAYARIRTALLRLAILRRG